MTGAFTYTDHRDHEEMESYMEDRIEFMKRRIAELEKENERLKQPPALPAESE